VHQAPPLLAAAPSRSPVHGRQELGQPGRARPVATRQLEPAQKSCWQGSRLATLSRRLRSSSSPPPSKPLLHAKRRRAHCVWFRAVWPSAHSALASQFFKRIFSPEVLTEPLPPALRLSLTRNFAFFTRIFTQFFGAPA
jgi:hypothetical protein